MLGVADEGLLKTVSWPDNANGCRGCYVSLQTKIKKQIGET